MRTKSTLAAAAMLPALALLSWLTSSNPVTTPASAHERKAEPGEKDGAAFTSVQLAERNLAIAARRSGHLGHASGQL